MFRERSPVEPRHVEVRKDDVDIEAVVHEDVEGFHAVSGQEHVMPNPRKAELEEGPDLRLVVHDWNEHPPERLLPSRPRSKDTPHDPDTSESRIRRPGLRV